MGSSEDENSDFLWALREPVACAGCRSGRMVWCNRHDHLLATCNKVDE